MNSLEYKENIIKLFREIKSCPQNRVGEHSIPVLELPDSNGNVLLRPLTWDSVHNDNEIRLLARWREKANPYFQSQFEVTLEGTRRWLVNGLLEVEDRILFMIDIPGGVSIGHVGLFRFDFCKRSCEIDNIIRGVESVYPGIMGLSIITMLKWAFARLKIRDSRLRVISPNPRAIKLYKKIGYREIGRIPLKKTTKGKSIIWEEYSPGSSEEIERYFLTMELSCNTFWEKHQKSGGRY